MKKMRKEFEYTANAWSWVRNQLTVSEKQEESDRTKLTNGELEK